MPIFKLTILSYRYFFASPTRTRFSLIICA